MKILSRDFTLREKVLLLILGIILIGLLYVRFIYMPVIDSIDRLKAEQSSAETELSLVNAQLTVLERKQAELDDIEGDGGMSYMPSYNNARNVTKLLNDVLGSNGYAITFSNVTRDGDQVRRNISLQFEAAKLDDVESILKQLSEGEYRCEIGSVSVNKSSRYGYDTKTTVNTDLTFYETMVGGTEDAGLPSK